MKPLGKVAMLLGVFLHYVMCYVYIFRVTFQYSGSMFIPYVMMLVHLAITLYNQFVFSVTCRAEGEEIPQLLNFNQGFLNFIRLIFLWDLFYFNSDCLDKLKATVQRFEGKWSFWINGARTFFLLRNIAYFIAIKNLQDFELAFFFCYFYAVVNLLLIFHDTKYVVAIICSFILIPFVIIGDCFTALFNKCKRNHQGNARAIERENLENANNAINVANAREDNNNFNNLEGERPRQLFNEIDPENEERLVIQRNNANNVQNNEGFQVNMRNLAFAFMDAANHQKKFLRLNSTLSVEMMMKNWSRKFTEEDTNACPSCCVCLEDFEVGENIMELHCNPKSHGHMFHMECIDSWSKKEKTCPLCRKNFIDIVRDEYSKGVLIKKKNEEFKAPDKLDEESNISEERKEVDRTVQSRRDSSESYEPSSSIYTSQSLSLHQIEVNEPYDPIAPVNNRAASQPNNPPANPIQPGLLQAHNDPSAPVQHPDHTPSIHSSQDFSIPRSHEGEPSNQGSIFYPRSSFSESMSSEMEADSS